MSKSTNRSRHKKLDHELSWPNNAYPIEEAATSPITYPLPLGEAERLIERDNWRKAQAVLIASQHISEFELKMLIKFEMLRWLGCGLPE